MGVRKRNLQIGDTVLVCSRAYLEKHFSNIGGFCYLTHPVIFTPEMTELCGKLCTVESIPRDNSVILAEDTNKRLFPAEALIHKNTPKK